MAEQGIERPQDDEINLLDYWRVVWKRRHLIGGLCFAAVFTALVFGLLSSSIYQSTATIITPREGPAGGVLAALGAAGIAQQLPSLSLPSLTPNRDVLVSILKSRTIAEKTVERLKLQEYYRAEHLQGAIGALQKATDISISREGVISVKVEDGDREMAAAIANAYTETLDHLIGQYGTGSASSQRRFIAEQLEKASKGLVLAEENLRRFQEKNRAVSISDQSRGAIEAAARLKGEIMASEVQLQVMRNFATESNPDVVRLRRRIGELKQQLAQAQYGAGMELPAVAGNSGHPQKEIFIPASRVPEVGLDLARLTRDLKVQETIYTLLTQQLEQTKIAEAQDIPIVQVLDRAVPALFRSKPQIKLNMALAGVTSLFLGIFLAFFLEYIERERARAGRLGS
jgi:uncharacterized protein involved in exopolysaccharide biosynthesis